MRNGLRSALILSIVSLEVANISFATEIEGPPEVIRFLRGVQEKNLSDYRSGRLVAKAHWVMTSAKKKSTLYNVQGDFLWNGEDCIWDVHVHEDRTDFLPEVQRREVGVNWQARRLLSLSDRAYFYRLGKEGIAPSLQERVAPRDRGVPREYWWRPENLWFRLDFSMRPWKDILDEKFFDGGFDRVLTKVDEATYELKHTHQASGDWLLLRFDLTKGGNLIAYERAGEQRGKGSYEWVQANDGHWFAKHTELVQHHAGLSEVPQVQFVIDISEFDVSAEIPKDKFQVASLKVDNMSSHLRTGIKGLEIVKQGSKRRAAPPAIPWEKLIRELKSARFATKQ